MTKLSSIFERAFAEQRIRNADGPVRFEDGGDTLLAALKDLGLEGRQAVGVCFDNGADCARAYAALAYLNLVAVPLPPSLPHDHRMDLWKRLECPALIDATGVTRLNPDAGPAWPDGIEWIMHSSGTTGIPKPIPITIDAMQKNADDTVRHLSLGRGAVHMGSMAMCYTNGLYNSFMLPLMTDGVSILAPVASAFSMRGWLATAAAARPEILWVNPAVVKMLLRSTGTRFENAKALVSCTAPLPYDDAVAAEAAFGLPVIQSYGLTETLIVTIEELDRKLDETFSSGLPISEPGTVTLDAEQRLTIANGAVTPGYPELVNHQPLFSLPEGTPGVRFTSSDHAEIDALGRCLITGRSSAMINVEGTKVSAELMELAMTAHPAITAAGVVAVADPRAGEKPMALVVVAAGHALDAQTLDALSALCVERQGPKARPANIVAVESIPTTANGKIDRTLLVKTANMLLQSQAQS
ncbi:MAG TPA: fatty acid--CoA ligase family protein [Magnetovibrio sp.]